MKKGWFFFVIIFLLLFSCMPQKEKNRINIESTGITSDSVFLFYKKAFYEYPEVLMDSLVEMVFIGLDGFKKIDGKVYFGGSIMVTDSVGEIVFKNDDVFMFIDETGVDYQLVKERLGMILEVGSPMIKGKTYFWENVIWDKKGETKIKTRTRIIPE